MLVPDIALKVLFFVEEKESKASTTKGEKTLDPALAEAKIPRPIVG